MLFRVALPPFPGWMFLSYQEPPFGEPMLTGSAYLTRRGPQFPNRGWWDRPELNRRGIASRQAFRLDCPMCGRVHYVRPLPSFRLPTVMEVTAFRPLDGGAGFEPASSCCAAGVLP